MPAVFDVLYSGIKKPRRIAFLRGELLVNLEVFSRFTAEQVG